MGVLLLNYNIAVVTSNTSWLPILASFPSHWAGNEDIHLASFPGCPRLQQYTGGGNGLGTRLGQASGMGTVTYILHFLETMSEQ